MKIVRLSKDSNLNRIEKVFNWFRFSGRGPEGDKGDKGDKGDTGATGPAGTGTTITGQTIDGGAGTVGKAYYLTSTANTWLEADQTTESTMSGQVGVCSAANEITEIGPVTKTAHGLGVSGLSLYVGVSGVVTETKPKTSGLFKKRLGSIKDANTFNINVSQAYSEVA